MATLKGDEIPDGEFLFLYVFPFPVPEGQLNSVPHGVFQNGHGQRDTYNLSVDWKARRIDPATSFHIQEGKTWVVEISVCEGVRNPVNWSRPHNAAPEPGWKQRAVYDPQTAEDDPAHGANEAHSLLMGSKKTGPAKEIAKFSTWHTGGRLDPTEA